MPEEIRVNRAPQQTGGQPARSDMQSGESMPSGSSKTPWIILVLVVVVIAVLGFLFRDKLFTKTPGADKNASYQAIFLTNGQVYFGKLSNPSGDYVTMKDIYYLQVVQQPPLQGSNQDQAAAAAAQQQISLVKLGNELHGPMDEMHISRAQVLFYEDLKSDSQVVTAIEQYKANPPK